MILREVHTLKVSHVAYGVMKRKRKQKFSAGILEEFVDATSRKTLV